jgi:hypothetical protein
VTHIPQPILQSLQHYVYHDEGQQGANSPPAAHSLMQRVRSHRHSGGSPATGRGDSSPAQQQQQQPAGAQQPEDAHEVAHAAVLKVGACSHHQGVATLFMEQRHLNSPGRNLWCWILNNEYYSLLAAWRGIGLCLTRARFRSPDQWCLDQVDLNLARG